jgi:uncharacterized protein
MAKFRILSLDGGGCWALIQVRALQALYGEHTRGHDVLALFDLVAANSGGSIVAAGLAEDFALSEMLAFFRQEQKRKSLFVRLPWYRRVVRVIGLGAAYGSADKLRGLQALLARNGNRPVDALPASLRHAASKTTHFLFVGFDYDRERAVYFRSNSDSGAGSLGGGQAHVPTAMAVHASTNAPISFFDEPAVIDEDPPRTPPRRLWDGAITGHNNPIVAAVVEALACGAVPAEIEALSLGTANLFLPMKDGAVAEDDVLLQERTGQNLLADIKKIAVSILADPPDVATFVAHVMLGQKLPRSEAEVPLTDGSVIRLNPLIQPRWDATGKRWARPPGLTIAQFKALRELNTDAVEDDEIARIDQLCTAWLADQVHNQPIRTNGRTLGCEIGHRLFSGAKAEWLRRCPLVPAPAPAQPVEPAVA